MDSIPFYQYPNNATYAATPCPRSERFPSVHSPSEQTACLVSLDTQIYGLIAVLEGCC
jgi:hypothetical protein